METNVLEKAANLAAESLKKIEAPAKAKVAEAEAKDAALKAQEKDEAKKIEGNKLAEAEARAKEDERILTIDDKELSESELNRKTELKETKKKKDESPDEKIKRVQESSQKRIDEIKSEMLAKENQNIERLKKLEAELSELKRPKVEEDVKAKSKREEAERIAKYVEEDKSKPREDRREMSKESLEEWYLEDFVEATTWIQERTNRRVEERKKVENPEVDKRKLADEFISKQNESRAKLFDKYPGVNPSKEKIAEFKAKAKDQAELSQLLKDDNEEFRICSEIVSENPKKYLESTDGPELVMAEIEKRLNKSKKIELTEEELEAKINAEAERRKLLDGEGVTSTKGKKMENKETTKSEQRQKLETIARKAKIPMEALDKTIERRRTIPGANVFEDNNE